MLDESVEQPVGPISSTTGVPGQRPLAQLEKESAKLRQLENKGKDDDNPDEKKRAKELIKAHKRGGPIMASSNLTEYLKRQTDILSNAVETTESQDHRPTTLLSRELQRLVEQGSIPEEDLPKIADLRARLEKAADEFRRRIAKWREEVSSIWPNAQKDDSLAVDVMTNRYDESFIVEIGFDFPEREINTLPTPDTLMAIDKAAKKIEGLSYVEMPGKVKDQPRFSADLIFAPDAVKSVIAPPTSK